MGVCVPNLLKNYVATIGADPNPMSREEDTNIVLGGGIARACRGYGDCFLEQAGVNLDSLLREEPHTSLYLGLVGHGGLSNDVDVLCSQHHFPTL